MTLRTLILATSAIVLSLGVMPTDAEAASRRMARHSAGMANHSPMRHSAMRARMGRRGGMMAARSRGRDAESGSVDQLNAQSLAAARGGAAPAAQ